MNAFNVGEKLVWIRVNDDDGMVLKDFVVVRRIPEKFQNGKTCYFVQLINSGELVTAFQDELFYYERI